MINPIAMVSLRSFFPNPMAFKSSLAFWTTFEKVRR